jgi:hypothetical protein
MRRVATILFGLLVVVGSVGCESCLDLDKVELVPAGSLGGSGGTQTGTATGTGGTGGQPPDPCEEVEGHVFVTVPVLPGGNARPCSAPSPASAGIRIYAYQPISGGCEAYATVSQLGSAEITGALRTSFRSDDTTYVVGTFRGGSIELPRSCDDPGAFELDLPSGAAEAIFVAQLRINGSVLCTEWVRTAGADTEGLLSVSAVESDGTGAVAIGGSLGGALTTFDDGVSTTDAQGTAFFAHYRGDGSLDELVAFDGGALDDVKGIDRFGGGWLLTGSLEREDPSCHGCSGTSHVQNAVGDCPAAGGGGVGGAGVGGAGGGAAGAGGGAGGSSPGIERHNAWLWRWTSTGPTCEPFDTYGSDRLTGTDAQAGFDVAAQTGASTCSTYWTGLAGRDVWRFDAAEPNSALYDAGGVSLDGFLMRLNSEDTLSCGPGASQEWSLRLTPTPSSAVAWGNRVHARACASGAFLTAFVTGGAQGSVALQRCAETGSCNSAAADVQLLNALSQMMVMGLDGAGSLSWYAVLGPVQESTVTFGGGVMGEIADNLAVDNTDHIVMAVTTSGPLTTSNIEDTACPDLADYDEAGTYLIRLGRDGSSGQAYCGWTAQLTP